MNLLNLITHIYNGRRFTSFVPQQFSVLTYEDGQSNKKAGQGNKGDLPVANQGVFDRVRLTNTRYLNGIGDPFRTLSIVDAGQTIDGVTGPSSEDDESIGSFSSITGEAVFVADDASGSDLYPNIKEWIVQKVAQGGQPQVAFLPNGSLFNQADAVQTGIIDPYIRTNPTLVSNITYAQGEREAQLVLDALGDGSGTGDPASIMSQALANNLITEWAKRHVEQRRAKREYSGFMNLPYFIDGFVLPADGGNYANNQQRLREAIAVQQMNLCRYSVRLNETGTAIEITDLGIFRRDFAWDTVNDAPIVTVSSEVSEFKDDNSYYIDARGYASDDTLHHNASAQLLIGKATKLLKEYLYGDGGVPPVTQLLGKIRPVFYVSPHIAEQTNTTLTIGFTASQVGTAHIGIYAAGSTKPTEAQLIAGTGAISKTTRSTVKRGAVTHEISGLSGGEYDVYVLIELPDVNSIVDGSISAVTMVGVVPIDNPPVTASGTLENLNVPNDGSWVGSGALENLFDDDGGLEELSVAVQGLPEGLTFSWSNGVLEILPVPLVDNPPSVGSGALESLTIPSDGSWAGSGALENLFEDDAGIVSVDVSGLPKGLTFSWSNDVLEILPVPL